MAVGSRCKLKYNILLSKMFWSYLLVVSVVLTNLGDMIEIEILDG